MYCDASVDLVVGVLDSVRTDGSVMVDSFDPSCIDDAGAAIIVASVRDVLDVVVADSVDASDSGEVRAVRIKVNVFTYIRVVWRSMIRVIHMCNSIHVSMYRNNERRFVC